MQLIYECQIHLHITNRARFTKKIGKRGESILKLFPEKIGIGTFPRLYNRRNCESRNTDQLVHQATALLVPYLVRQLH